MGSEEEEASDYGRGGYLHVALGDTFKEGRYVVRRKLGWGMFSTVWLSYDTVDRRHIALKISRSDRETTETAKAEIAVLQRTTYGNDTIKRHANIVALLDSFAHPATTDPKLVHMCLVFELLGPNLLTFLESHQENVRQGGKAERGECGGLPIALVKELTRQILMGTAYLHDRCRHIHTDLKLENIAIALEDMERVVEDDLARTEPVSVRIESTDSMEVEIFNSQPIPTPVYALTTPRSSYDGDELASEISSSPPESMASSAAPSTAPSSSAPIQITPISTRNHEHTHEPASPSSPISLSAFASSFFVASSSPFQRFSIFSGWPFAKSPPKETIPSMVPPRIATPIPPTPPPPVAAPKPKPPKTYPKLSVKLVDFGNAQPMSETYNGRIQTRQYRAPEVVIGRRDWDQKVDIWSIACIVFELVTGDYLFDPPEGIQYKDREHIVQVLELMQPEYYDRKWAMGGKYSGNIFDMHGDIPRERQLNYRSLEKLLMEKYNMEPKDAKGFADFLSPMLEFMPSERARARTMLSHPWLL